ncbi:MAG: tRNA pseudouridine(13) synthase TruD [Bacillota bacterium]
MRLKATPDDFQVHEATDLRIRQRPGPYRVYLLEKVGWNTVDALGRIARARGVPLARFAYGGKKDRHARTSQYVTVADPRDLSLAAPGYTFRFLGYSDEPMGPDRILYNRFTLTIRELTPGEAERLQAGLRRVQEQGFINYFDDQRFGSLDRERGFIAERLLQGRWEEALAIALTAVHPEESREAKARKRALRERWGQWAECLALSRTRFEREAFGMLAGAAEGAAPKRPEVPPQVRERAAGRPAAGPGAAALASRRCGPFQAALARAPAEDRAMWAAAYQAFLWNQWVARLLRSRGWVAAWAPGRAGPYLFPGDLPPVAQAELARWVLPLPGRGMRVGDPGLREALLDLLAERGLALRDLQGPPPVPGVDLRAVTRPVRIRPEGMAVGEPEPDDRYPGKLKLTVSFQLPRAAYATMLIKAAAARPGLPREVWAPPA